LELQGDGSAERQMDRYRKLDAAKIVSTLERLQRRIEERFPEAGLAIVGLELTEIARGARAKAVGIARPNLWLRGGTAVIILAGLVLLYYVGGIIQFKRTSDNLFGVMQGIEASVNLIIVMGAGVLFLSTLEGRWKRHKALADLNELRNIIHVIDMHQLTKDPSTTSQTSSRTKHSPKRNLTPFQLMRYLDYSSEMLSLTAKVAALYGQSFHDTVVLATASDLDQITSNMTNKIWQKINMIQADENWKAASTDRAKARLARADPKNWVRYKKSEGTPE